MWRRCISLVALGGLVVTIASWPVHADPQPDFSHIDPVWAAGEMDTSLRSGTMGTAWMALKDVFPDDYGQLTMSLAQAVIHHQDWASISREFLRRHVSGSLEIRQNAPAAAQAEFQRQKASFLVFISKTNPEACAYLSFGRGDPSSLAKMSIDETKHYSDLIAATVRVIGAARKSQTHYGELTAEDISKLASIAASQGVSDTDLDRILLGQLGETPAEKCRYGVLRNAIVAAAPDEIVAKMAFR